MSKLKISVSSKYISINDKFFINLPTVEEFCYTIGSNDLVDGNFVFFNGKPKLQFKYFDRLGIGILETISLASVRDITIFMRTPSSKRKPISQFSDDSGQRETTSVFTGLLELNGKELRSPLPLSCFPVKGDMNFINRIALGKEINAHFSVRLKFIEYIGFEFKK